MSNIKVVDKIEKENNTKNVTLFLGNGFDLNMGLDTSYKSFVNHYVNEIKSADIYANKLKELLKQDDENWSDLEIQIGKLTAEYEDADSFYNAFCDMGNELINYLKNEEIKFDLKSDSEKEKIAQSFIEDIITLLNNYHIKDNVSIGVLTLNYTRIIYKLLSLIRFKSIKLNSLLKEHKMVFNDVINCHGNLENGQICFGVNSREQISNKDIFLNRPRVIQQMIKPERNRTLKIVDMQKCKDYISNANIILNYGCSFGATDNYWVKLLSRWLGRVYTSEGIATNNWQTGLFDDKKLLVYSNSEPNKTQFNALELEFEDRIKEKYSFADDDRIVIIYDNVFKNLKNILK